MYIVTAIPGCGKTTVLNEIKRLKEIEILNYGSLMLEIAKKEYNIEDRDALRKADVNIQKKIQHLVGEELSKKKDVILDTHLAIKVGKHRFLPGLPFHILKQLHVDMLIYITAEPNEILERRNNDPSRKRDQDTLDEIKEQDEINKKYLIAYSALTGAPIYIVKNKQGKLDETVNKILEVL